MALSRAHKPVVLLIDTLSEASRRIDEAMRLGGWTVINTQNGADAESYATTLGRELKLLIVNPAWLGASLGPTVLAIRETQPNVGILLLGEPDEYGAPGWGRGPSGAQVVPQSVSPAELLAIAQATLTTLGK